MLDDGRPLPSAWGEYSKVKRPVLNQLPKGIYIKYGDSTPAYALLPFLVYHLGNCMPDDDSCSFDLLLRQSRCNAHFQRRLELPAGILRSGKDSSRHALESGDENPVRQALWTN